MSLENTYKTTLQNNTAQQDLLTAQEINRLSKEQLKEPGNWHKGLATLDQAISQLPDNKSEIFELYELLFKHGFDFKASVYLDEEDYKFHLETVLSVLERLAAHFPIVYTQIAFQYREARRLYRDAEKVDHYLTIAVDLKVELAVAVKGYLLYYGVLLEKDEETGLQLLNSSDSIWNKLYRGYVALNKGEKEEIPALIAELKENPDPSIKKNALLFEANYFDATDHLDAAKASYEEIINTYEADFALFRLGSIQFFLAENEADKTEAFRLWQNAFELGTIEAVNSLGFHSLPENKEDSTYEQAIHWFELGYLYCNPYASYRLALIYLYNPEFLDVKKGMDYLDEAIKYGSIDAAIEKAELLIEGELAEKNEQEGLTILKEAAEKKQPYALNRIGYLYESGALITDEPDLNSALSYYEQAAELNFPVGLNNVARIHRYGLAGEPDIEKARQYFERGAELNSPYSMTELAFMYEDGTLDKDYQKSFELFHRAAELNYPFAIHTTGNYLKHGYHNEQPDPKAAFEWYLKGAEMNDINCLFELGWCYRFGIGTEENPDKAVAYYKRAAEGGNAKALVELGLCYEHEYGVEFNAQKAFDYMQQAAEQGYYYGEYKLGYYYMHGLIEQDTKQALHWLQKAVEQGFPAAMLETGDYYMYDYDRIDQSDKAFPYYQQALEQEVVHEGLGLCYEYGIGVEANNTEAFKYYEMAANNRNVIAMYHTGRCYLNGTGVKTNEAAAFRWFHEAAQNNNTGAQYYTGSLLLNGTGVATNKEEGIEWLLKAAEDEHAEAQFELGNCYLMGDGVEENEDTAMYWFERAADNGHEKSMKLTGRKRGK